MSETKNRDSYQPDGLNRLFWLTAKNIAVPDPDFGAKDNVLFAMSLYSGAKLKDIRMSDMVDMVIRALAEYYQHKGIAVNDLHDLLNPLRTDYAVLTNQKWDQDQASQKIIESCMTRLALAPMCSNDKVVLVDLGNPEVNYDEVWTRAHEEEREFRT